MARKVTVQNDIEDDDEDNAEFDTMPESSEEALDRILSKLDASQEIDVFEELGSRAAENGLFLLFDIYRDGSFLGRKTHPYSWPSLQKEFGGGNYRIDVKHPSTKKFVKKNSRIVYGEAKENTSKESNQNSFVHVPAPQPQNDGSAMVANILAPILQVLTAVISKPQGNNNESGIGQLLIQMQQAQSQQAQMMMGMFQNFAESARKEQQSNTDFQSKLFEKMNDRIEKSLNNDKNGYTAGDILKATQDAQENGFKMYMMLQDRAETIADEKLAQMPENAEKEGSALDGILKAMAPLLMSGLAGQNTQPQSIEPQQNKPRIATPLRQNDIEFPRTQLPQKSRVVGATAVEQPQQSRRGVINNVPTIVTASGFPRVDFDALRNAKNRPGASASPVTIVETAVPQAVFDRFQNHWYPKIAKIIEPMITNGISLTVSNVTTALDRAAFDFALFREEISSKAIEMIAKQAPEPFGDLFRGVYSASSHSHRHDEQAVATSVAETAMEI